MDKIKTDEQYGILTLRRSHRQNLNGPPPLTIMRKMFARWPYACYHLTDDTQARPLFGPLWQSFGISFCGTPDDSFHVFDDSGRVIMARR